VLREVAAIAPGVLGLADPSEGLLTFGIFAFRDGESTDIMVVSVFGVIAE
jgi:hypothetical protein